MYAIIETGGKQYRVSPGQVLDVDFLNIPAGNSVELDRVLLVGADDNQVTVGTPVVEGAKIIATSQGEQKGEKIAVMRYKAKARSHRKTGHRQLYTRIVVDKIIGPGIPEEAAPQKTRRRKEEVKEDGA